MDTVPDLETTIRPSFVRQELCFAIEYDDDGNASIYDVYQESLCGMDWAASATNRIAIDAIVELRIPKAPPVQVVRARSRKAVTV